MSNKKSEAVFTQYSYYAIYIDAYPEIQLAKDGDKAPELLFGTRTNTYVGLVIRYHEANSSYVILHRLNMPSTTTYQYEYERIKPTIVGARRLSYSNTHKQIYYTIDKSTDTESLIEKLDELARALAW